MRTYHPSLCTSDLDSILGPTSGFTSTHGYEGRVKRQPSRAELRMLPRSKRATARRASALARISKRKAKRGARS